MKKKYIVTTLLAVAGCVAVAVPAQSKINIETMVVTGFEHNTNFWAAETNEVAVDTYFVKPGITLGYETAKSKIEAELVVESFWYHDSDTPPAGVRDSSDDDYVGFSANISAETQVTDRLTLAIEDSIYKTRDPAQSDAFSDSVARDKYVINRVTPSLYYDFGNKFAFELKYSNIYTEYSDDVSEGSTEHRGVANLFYNLNSLSSVYLSYNFWERDYDGTTSTYTSNEVKLNYVRQFHYLSMDVGAGYHNRSFDDTSREDLDMFSWHAILKAQNPPAPAADPRAHMLLSVSQNYNDAGTGDQYYVATRLDAEVGYIFMDKVETLLTGYYQNSDYENDPSERSDDTYSVSGILGYQFWEYGKVNFELGYKKRDSNIAGLSYDDTFASVSLDFNYDLGSR